MSVPSSQCSSCGDVDSDDLTGCMGDDKAGIAASYPACNRCNCACHLRVYRRPDVAECCAVEGMSVGVRQTSMMVAMA